MLVSKLMLLRKLAVFGAFIALLNGCGATEAVEDVFTTITKADITIVASDSVNPDMNGRPSPIMVQVFELKSTSGFNNADFFTLYDRGAAELGADYVNRDEFKLKPGQVIEFKREFSLDTRYIGIIAAYRDINNSVWRQTIQIESDSNSEIEIKLGSNALEISQE